MSDTRVHPDGNVAGHTPPEAVTVAVTVTDVAGSYGPCGFAVYAIPSVVGNINDGFKIPAAELAWVTVGSTGMYTPHAAARKVTV